MVSDKKLLSRRQEDMYSPAAFIPALSPPEVKTAILRCLLTLPAALAPAEAEAEAEGMVGGGVWVLSDTPSRSLLVASGLDAACPPSDMLCTLLCCVVCRRSVCTRLRLGRRWTFVCSCENRRSFFV